MRKTSKARWQTAVVFLTVFSFCAAQASPLIARNHRQPAANGHPQNRMVQTATQPSSAKRPLFFNLSQRYQFKNKSASLLPETILWDAPTTGKHLTWQEVLNPTPNRTVRANHLDVSYHDHSDHDHGHDDDDDLSELYVLGGILAAIGLSAPFWAPPKTVSGTNDLEGYYADFPYADNVPGHMVYSHEITTLSDDGSTVQSTETLDFPCANPRFAAARIRADWTSNYDDFQRISSHILVGTHWRVGIEADYNYYREEISGGRRDTHLGDVNVVYRFAQGEHAQWRTGIGINWMTGEGADPGGEAGFNWTYGFDLFPVKPLVISGEFDWGLIGDEELFHARGTVGVLLNRFEAYAGYDYYFRDNEARNQGVITGIRLWF